MTKAYIGLATSFHDSALAIVNERGEVVFAEATERHLQVKRAINIAPDFYGRVGELIEKYCRTDAEIVAAFSWTQEVKQSILKEMHQLEEEKKKIRDSLGQIPPPMHQTIELLSFLNSSQLRAVSFDGVGLTHDLAELGRESSVVALRHYDHHYTHAATSCFTSPFSESVCAIVDGYGENGSFACYAHKEGKLQRITQASSSAASLGGFFTEICKACGFGYLTGEEWKVMGLASYGSIDQELYAMLKDFIYVNGVSFERPSEWEYARILQGLRKRARKKGEPVISAADIACTGQKVFNELLIEFLKNLYRMGVSNNLVLGGGCALNSSANGTILDGTPFKRLHVFSAPADDGNAIGAALLAYQEDTPKYRPSAVVHSPYLGSEMSRETISRVQRFSGIKTQCICDDPAARAAELLADGKIIGWIQGRAEFGPRALGNRSILADPRSPSIKEVINERVKFREEFRPFAPSILHEHGPAYFENYQESPYMERTLRFRPEVRGRVPGVVHMDGTGRLQSVRKDWNERYYRLIRHFFELTGIPMVLNTSFNVMGKPISHTVEDVLAVFFTSGLDAIFLGDLLLEK